VPLLATGQFGAERGFDAASEPSTLVVLGSRTRPLLSPSFSHQLQLAIEQSRRKIIYDRFF
jgi:hypothetical protein